MTKFNLGLSINHWWDTLNAAHQVFWFIAIVFSILLLIQIIMLIIGFETETSDAVDHPIDSPGVEHEFSALSVRSIIAFFTFFGWTGVLTMNNHLGIWLSVFFATLAGLAAMFVVAWLMFKFAQLEQSGTLNLYHALNQAGEVYIPVPPNKTGRGRITLMIDGRSREMDAMTEGGPLKTGQPVRVTDILEDNILMVEAADPDILPERLTF